MTAAGKRYFRAHSGITGVGWARHGQRCYLGRLVIGKLPAGNEGGSQRVNRGTALCRELLGITPDADALANRVRVLRQSHHDVVQVSSGG